MNIYILLFYEFFKIGLLAVGGGYATLPFLYYLSQKYNWYTIDELTNMIAVSNLTPGPIGINMATYAGYTTAGISGSLIATIAITLPALLIIFIIIKILKKYNNNTCITDIFSGLRPAACAMISAIGIKLFIENIVNVNIKAIQPFHTYSNLKEFALFIILTIFLLKLKKHPAAIIGIGSILGIIFNLKFVTF